MSKDASDIIIYKSEDGLTDISVRVEDETVWLTIEQMSDLFNKGRSTINEHILNIYKEAELTREETMRKIGNTDFSTKYLALKNHPALAGTPPKEGNRNKSSFFLNSPPLEGWQAKPDGVVLYA